MLFVYFDSNVGLKFQSARNASGRLASTRGRSVMATAQATKMMSRETWESGVIDSGGCGSFLYMYHILYIFKYLCRRW